MSRVEVIGDATLYLGHCEDVDLAWRYRHDLLLTDPPYGVGLVTEKPSRRVRSYTKSGDVPRTAKTSGHDFDPITGDDSPFDPSLLTPFRHAVIWGANHFADKLPASPCWFAWDKKAGKAAASSIGDCELAWTAGLPFVTVRLFSHMWAGFQRDSEVGDKRLHPAQKPVALMQWCLSFFDNETVVDPYMGSGCVGVAAIRECRRYVGIECHERYFDIACRRIEQATRQRDLFVHAPPAADPAAARTAELFAREGQPWRGG